MSNYGICYYTVYFFFVLTKNISHFPIFLISVRRSYILQKLKKNVCNYVFKKRINNHIIVEFFFGAKTTSNKA